MWERPRVDFLSVALRTLIKRILLRSLPLSVYLQINAKVAAREIRSGRRTEAEIEMLSRFVKNGDQVVDIGANHGLYAKHLSQLVGVSGKVHCFEPIPQNLFILECTIKSLKLLNVQVHPVACGDQAEIRTFHIPQVQGIPCYGLAHLDGNERQTRACQVVKLDDVVQGPVQFIKCDVEGAELLVFRGARHIIRESRPVLLVEMEMDRVWTERLDYSPFQCWTEIFVPLGYRMFRVNDHVLHEADGFTKSGNYFLIPAESSGMNGS